MTFSHTKLLYIKIHLIQAYNLHSTTTIMHCQTKLDSICLLHGSQEPRKQWNWCNHFRTSSIPELIIIFLHIIPSQMKVFISTESRHIQTSLQSPHNHNKHRSPMLQDTNTALELSQRTVICAASFEAHLARKKRVLYYEQQYCYRPWPF